MPEIGPDDGWLLLLELDGASADAVLRRYTWGLDVAGLAGRMNSLAAAGGIGGLLAVQDAGASQDYVYFHDALGSVGQVLDLAAQTAGAAMVAKYEYDPYGHQTGVAGTYDQPFRFSGKYHDAETGLGYWGYRYYNPVLGRWINRDPLGEPGGLNLYAYCGNGPAGRIDALGHEWATDCPPGAIWIPGFGCTSALEPLPPHPEEARPPSPPLPPGPSDRRRPTVTECTAQRDAARAQARADWFDCMMADTAIFCAVDWCRACKGREWDNCMGECDQDTQKEECDRIEADDRAQADYEWKLCVQRAGLPVSPPPEQPIRPMHYRPCTVMFAYLPV